MRAFPTRWLIAVGLTCMSLLVLQFAVACGGDDGGGSGATATAGTPSDGETPGGPTATDTGVTTEMSVSLTNDPFALTPSQNTAPAGGFVIDVTNDGSVGHMFIIIKTDLAPDALPVENSTANLEGLDVITSSNLVTNDEPLEPGASLEVQTTLEPGSYVLICNVADHYSAGMSAGLTVQ